MKTCKLHGVIDEARPQFNGLHITGMTIDWSVYCIMNGTVRCEVKAILLYLTFSLAAINSSV